MGRAKEADLSPDLQSNLNKLVDALNIIRKAYGKPMSVSSGYRPPEVNASVGGAKKSHHMSCMACDFKDADGKLDEWLSNNQDLLEKAGLWQEHPEATLGWAHLDVGSRAIKDRPGCGKRQFRP